MIGMWLLVVMIDNMIGVSSGYELMILPSQPAYGLGQWNLLLLPIICSGLIMQDFHSGLCNNTNGPSPPRV
jgi:hypothetical protein